MKAKQIALWYRKEKTSKAREITQRQRETRERGKTKVVGALCAGIGTSAATRLDLGFSAKRSIVAIDGTFIVVREILLMAAIWGLVLCNYRLRQSLKGVLSELVKGQASV